MRMPFLITALTSAIFGILALAWIFGTDALLSAGVGALKEGRDGAAFGRLRIAATLGNSTAQELVGTMYAFGWGTSRNDDEAIKWFRRARLWPDVTTDRAAVSEYYVGESFAKGIQIGKSDDDALKWFRLSANGGYWKAQELLGDAYERGLYGLSPDKQQADYWHAIARSPHDRK